MLTRSIPCNVHLCAVLSISIFWHSLLLPPPPVNDRWRCGVIRKTEHAHLQHEKGAGVARGCAVTLMHCYASESFLAKAVVPGVLVLPFVHMI